MQIGPFKLANPWILAPMAGISQMPYRTIVRRLGAAAAPTELISAKGLCYGQKRTEAYLRHDRSEDPFWVQLFGGEPEFMAKAAVRAVALGAKIIDINMGCPVRKVVSTGAGAALMRDPKRAAAIVSAVAHESQAVVTVKIRSGWDNANIAPWDLVAVLADAGAAAVAIHGRTSVQAYRGRADWGVIAELVARSPIPVIGNGDANTAEAARALQAQTGCAGVMIGRGALGNPWIFAELAYGQSAPTPVERWEVVKDHLAQHVAYTGSEDRGLRSFRPTLAWYSRGLAGSSAFRHEIMHTDTLALVLAKGEAFFCSATAAVSASDLLDDAQEDDPTLLVGGG